MLISKTINSSVDKPDSYRVRKILFIAGLILVNATMVHFVFAKSWEVSLGSYELTLKFTLLFFMIVAAIRTPADFRLVIFAMVLGAGYLGYEATINERGRIEDGRLEGVGAPGANQANQLASLCVTILPLAGALFLTGRWHYKLAMLAVTPLILNVVLLCSSRGAFLAAIASAIVFAIIAPKSIRRTVIKLLMLGCVATWLLLGDPQIVERFFTIFTSSEERDESASSRLDYWTAGMRMIADYPLGAGGYGFKRVHGPKYIKEVNSQEFSGRSVHNGFINEACEWGLQGFLARMMFIATGVFLALHTARQCSQQNDNTGAVLGCALISSMAAFLISCVFGDYLDAEWGYWCVALCVAFGRLFGQPSFQTNPIGTPFQGQPVQTPQYWPHTAVSNI